MRLALLLLVTTGTAAFAHPPGTVRVDIYPPPPTVIYREAYVPRTVIYQAPRVYAPPPVIYQAPRVYAPVYAPAPVANVQYGPFGGVRSVTYANGITQRRGLIPRTFGFFFGD
jgi:hypothetical protein